MLNLICNKCGQRYGDSWKEASCRPSLVNSSRKEELCSGRVVALDSMKAGAKQLLQEKSTIAVFDRHNKLLVEAWFDFNPINYPYTVHPTQGYAEEFQSAKDAIDHIWDQFKGEIATYSVCEWDN